MQQQAREICVISQDPWRVWWADIVCGIGYLWAKTEQAAKETADRYPCSVRELIRRKEKRAQLVAQAEEEIGRPVYGWEFMDGREWGLV